MAWWNAWPLWILDALFLALFSMAGLHARRLLEKESRWWEFTGYTAVWVVAVAWAMWRLQATLLAQLLLATAVAAVAVPMLRGLRGLGNP